MYYVIWLGPWGQIQQYSLSHLEIDEKSPEYEHFWCPLLPAGCPGTRVNGTGMAGFASFLFFWQRARRALDFTRAGGQNGHGHAH